MFYKYINEIRKFQCQNKTLTMMRNFTYKLLVSIVFFIAVIVGSNAQNAESLIVTVIVNDSLANNNGIVRSEECRVG